MVFDFLLSLFFPLSYFVLFILEVTAGASASVLLSAGWSTQSLFWKSTPETWDGKQRVGPLSGKLPTKAHWSVSVVWVMYKCRKLPSSKCKWDPFLQILGHPSLYLSFFIAGKTSTHLVYRILGDFDDVMMPAATWEQDCD